VAVLRSGLVLVCGESVAAVLHRSLAANSLAHLKLALQLQFKSTFGLSGERWTLEMSTVYISLK